MEGRLHMGRRPSAMESRPTWGQKTIGYGKPTYIADLRGTWFKPPTDSYQWEAFATCVSDE